MIEITLLPKGDILLADGRSLRRVIGVDLQPLVDEHTAHYIVEYARWLHRPSSFSVIASVDDTEKWGWTLHVSMSYPDKDPSWDEIKMVKRAFYGPEVDVAMILPREEDYVNVHNHCFHLWPIHERWGIR